MPPFMNVKNLFIAGLIGEVAFEAYAWLLSPILFGVELAPANLVMALVQKVFGISISYEIAFVMHFFVGAVAFSAFVALVHLVTKTQLIVSGAIAGLVLWFVAQGLLAPFIGRSFMMDFGTYTQSSFVGHVGMTVLIAWVMVMQRSKVAEQAA